MVNHLVGKLAEQLKNQSAEIMRFDPKKKSLGATTIRNETQNNRAAASNGLVKVKEEHDATTIINAAQN